MKYIINLFTGSNNYQVLIDSDEGLSRALWRFLNKWYPCDIRHEQVEEGRFEPIAVCKAFKNKLMMQGKDVTASSEIVLFSIKKWEGEAIENPLNPNVLVKWVENAYNEKQKISFLNDGRYFI